MESLKINETKGCHMFCTGLVRQGTASCMCVAIKRTIQVYELNKSRQRHRKLKDIQVPGHVEFIELVSEKLCVGYPSTFAIYSVQGDAAPMSKWLVVQGDVAPSVSGGCSSQCFRGVQLPVFQGCAAPSISGGCSSH